MTIIEVFKWLVTFFYIVYIFPYHVAYRYQDTGVGDHCLESSKSISRGTIFGHLAGFFVSC